MSATLAKCGHEATAEYAYCENCMAAYRAGEAANDHNRRVYRKQRGTTQGNPYEVNSDLWKAWKNGYAYRDMVNDG